MSMSNIETTDFSQEYVKILSVTMRILILILDKF